MRCLETNLTDHFAHLQKQSLSSLLFQESSRPTHSGLHMAFNIIIRLYLVMVSFNLFGCFVYRILTIGGLIQDISHNPLPVRRFPWKPVVCHPCHICCPESSSLHLHWHAVNKNDFGLLHFNLNQYLSTRLYTLVHALKNK